MAARRLLIVMLVLLGISSVIAIVVPEPSERDSDPPPTAATGESGSNGATVSAGADGPQRKERSEASRTTHETVDLDGGNRFVELAAEPGSRLVLTVESNRGALVEIRGLGLTSFADRYAPAVFDVYVPDEPGRFAVAEVGEDPAARIVTREPRSS